MSPAESFDDPELERRVRAAEEWSGDPGRAVLPRADLVALAVLVVLTCAAAWLWGAP